MKDWQQVILLHHPNAIILNCEQIKIPSVAWIPETGEGFDNVITKSIESKVYTIEEYKENTSELTKTETETNLYCYLGY